jgi:hypothetical protein
MLATLTNRLPSRARANRTAEERAQALRRAVHALPFTTRQAMLIGIESNKIIIGAYADDRGGVCPMLAAHRCGGRTSFAAFARAWDDFTNAGRCPKPASTEQLLALRLMLEATLAENAEAQVPAPGVTGESPDTGERDRTGELSHQHGWAWLRLFRRYDDYAEAVARLEDEGRECPADDTCERTLSTH